jgi:hypothetical protein
MRRSRFLVSLVVLAGVFASFVPRARAVDATGTWALCLTLSSGNIGCPMTRAVTLVATADAYTIDMSDTPPGTCVLTGTIDPVSGAMTSTPATCFGATTSGTAAADALTGSMLLGLCSFDFTGVRACDDCADGNQCTTDGCGATACSAPGSSCTLGLVPNLPCDDGDACTTESRCPGAVATAPACRGAADLDCDDGNGCTADACDPTAGCVHAFTERACDDGNACTTGDACAAGSCTGGAPLACEPCEQCDPLVGCLARPRDDCRAARPSRKTSVRLENAGDDARDRLVWRWRGEATSSGDFGDPVATDAYTVCAYDQSATRLVLRATAPAGGTCPVGRGGTPCWGAVGRNARRGYAYRDGGLLDPDGLRRVRLVPGATARIAVDGAGANLGVPSPLAVEPPLVVQLQGGAGACWESRFAEPRRNREDVFEATAK